MPDDRDARIAPTPERLRYHASRFLQADGSPTFMSDWLRDCADEMERRDQQIAGLEGERGELLDILYHIDRPYGPMDIAIGNVEEASLDAFINLRHRTATALAANARAGQERKGAGDA